MRPTALSFVTMPATEKPSSVSTRWRRVRCHTTWRPDPCAATCPIRFPVALLGRLAVHADHESKGIGGGLLADATRRCLATAAEGPGTAAILCHAIDESAKAFYLHNGFLESPIEALTVMLPLRGLAAALRVSMGR